MNFWALFVAVAAAEASEAALPVPVPVSEDFPSSADFGSAVDCQNFGCSWRWSDPGGCFGSVAAIVFVADFVVGFVDVVFAVAVAAVAAAGNEIANL